MKLTTSQFVMVTVRVLVYAAVGAALSGAFFLAFALLSIPPFDDVRKGYPAIPRDLGYAIGTKGGLLKLGAFLYAVYGAFVGLLVIFCKEVLRASRKRS